MVTLSDKEIKIGQLFVGNTTGYKSQSEAELAYLRYTLYWIDSSLSYEEKYNRLLWSIRTSGLYRDKWEREDYARQTIDLVLKESGFRNNNIISEPGGDGHTGAASQASAQLALQETEVEVIPFSVDDFKTACEGLKGDEFADTAYEMIDEFATLPKSEVNKIQRFLKKGGMKSRDIISWQQAVREKIKEIKADEPIEEDPAKGVIPRLGDYFLENEHFAVNAGELLYVYQDGVYLPEGKKFISLQMKEVLEEWNLLSLWSRYRIDEVVAYIKMQSPQLWEAYPYEWSDWINISCSLINLRTKERKRHSPDFLSAVQYPIKYDPEAKPVKRDKFYKRVLPDDAYKAGVHWQLCAWVLMNPNPGQKALKLVGPGNDGKSRFLKSLVSLAGEENTSHLSLQTICNNRFAVSGIIGKPLNTCADLPSSHLADTAIFKAITGDDDISGEYKNGAFFTYRSHCKLAFSCNQFASSSDTTPAFFRRWLVMKMSKTISKNEEKSAAEIDAALSQESELSGVLNKALEVAPEVLKKGVAETKSMQQALAEFIAAVDTFGAWARSNLIAVETGKALLKDIMSSYQAYCKKHKLKGKKSEDVKVAIAKRYPGAVWGEITSYTAEQGYGYTGLKVTD